MNKSERELVKKEIRTYYESHYEDIRKVARLFKVNERTLYKWIQDEAWEKGKLIKNTDLKKITKTLLEDKEVLGQVNLAKATIKENIKNNMNGLYAVYEERILDNTADELILKAMSETFINMQITKTALIAQSEFNRLATLSVASIEPNPKVISAAKDVVSIYIDMKKALFPHQENTNINVNTILSGVITKEEIAQLSDDQIREAIAKMNETKQIEQK